VRAREARSDFGRLFALCVEMMKGEASPGLAVAIRMMIPITAASTSNDEAVEALIREHA